MYLGAMTTPSAYEANFGRLAPVNPNVSFRGEPNGEYVVLARGVEIGRIRRAESAVPWLERATGTASIVGFELVDLAGKPVVWASDWYGIEALASDFARSELCAAALAQARKEILEGEPK